MPKLNNIKVNLSLPYIGGVEGTWEPDESERKAAWEMYVELVTRVSVVELKSDEGLLREALSSIYALFAITREILKTAGPGVAKPKNQDKGHISFGYLAIAILNTVLRPLLAKWHPILLDYEDKRPADVSPLEHERSWAINAEIRAEIKKARLILIEYANLLAEVAEVPSLIIGDTASSE